MAMGLIVAAPGLAMAPAAAQARELLGIFDHWGAFRDSETARCFAIAQPIGARPMTAAGPGQWRPFAAIGYWPRRNVRGQINFRLSRELAPGTLARLTVGDRHFDLSGGGADVWARDRRDDAAILAALRAGGTMTVRGRARSGASVFDRYTLRGAATAIDAAALGCARVR